MDLAELKKKLTHVGLKATHPRLVVLNALMSANNHPSAEHIFEGIRDAYPSIAKGTVYRILEHFVEAGLAYRVSTKQGVKRYDANLDQHSHIYCLKTHTIEDFYSRELDDMLKEFFNNKKMENFRINDIKLQINGEKIDATKKVTIS